jgi:hypothetical protein
VREFDGHGAENAKSSCKNELKPTCYPISFKLVKKKLKNRREIISCVFSA